MQPTIHSLHIYPIKSCQGIDVDTAELTDTGFKYDRHWMLVDKRGQFISQRQIPQMARIHTQLKDDTLVVSTPDTGELNIPLQGKDQNRLEVQIWNDSCSASLVSGETSRWFSETLDVECDLVFLPPSEKRRVNPEYAQSGQIVGFADGFPLLVLSRASIDLLNSQMDEAVSIDRFRANIVIEGCAAHAEDQWSKISVNDIDILLAKACSRCVIPSIDQHTAEKHQSILKTLAGYRRREGKVTMGQNGLHLSNGQLSIGQPLNYTQR